MIITRRAYPRAALIGNPSDGYFGKTIALTFGNFHAEVTLYESPELEILPYTRDHSVFPSVQALAEDVRLFGYYGGIRLLKAAIKRFHDYCRRHGIDLPDRNFTIRYKTDIPHLVGLAGSSAIITACFRALMAFYGVSILKPILANLVLSVETDELAISAGLQDRVAQVYQGVVYMDFDKDYMDREGHGYYEELDPEALPGLYIAYRSALSQGSEMVHNTFRERYRRQDPDVLDAIGRWIALTGKARALLVEGRADGIGHLMDENFDTRARTYTISDGNMKMIHAARAAGASAKFTGSGGAIIGTYEDRGRLEDLKKRLEPLDIKVVEPVVVPPFIEEEA
jgi:glucuronokinase